MHVFKDNYEIFQNVAVKPVAVNLFALCTKYKVCEASSPFLVGWQRGRSGGGVLYGKTFLQLCSEHCKL